MQAKFLKEKAKTLLEASQTLESAIAECSDDKSIEWKTIIKLIEVYKMTQQLEQSWAGKVLTAEELKQYTSKLNFLSEELYSGKITFGEYNKKRIELANESSAKMTEAFRIYHAQARNLKS